jgi:exodeoxyribonuclease VII large subunit
MKMDDKLSLTELQLIIRDSLYISLPGMYWVVAEIAEIRINQSGHCYLELIEKDPAEINIKAKVRAVIWAKKFSFLNLFFENATGESLREGFKVLLKITVEYHEIYGLNLVINDIDPSYTIGEMAVKRQQIIRRLEQEGVFTMNKELDFPMLPRRIAIISSKNAAGYTDFLKHLNENNFGYVFQTVLFEASMQGTETEISVINTLIQISEKTDLFDVVALIRGGGSQSDLSWFDNYNIAYHITQFPLPVLTGIGHEKDITVTDMVAYQSLKTPTAVADFIVNSVAETENRLTDLSKSISEISQSVLSDAREKLDMSKMKLIPVTMENIAAVKKKLSSIVIAAINIGKEYLIREEITPANMKSRLISGVKTYSSEKEKQNVKYLSDLRTISDKYLKLNVNTLDRLKNSLFILDPENVLRRGYTITSFNDRIIKNSGVPKDGDDIETRFSDGTVKSRVMKG